MKNPDLDLNRSTSLELRGKHLHRSIGKQAFLNAAFAGIMLGTAIAGGLMVTEGNTIKHAIREGTADALEITAIGMNRLSFALQDLSLLIRPREVKLWKF